MEDKKSSLYSLSNKVKNGWIQGGGYGYDTEIKQYEASESKTFEYYAPERNMSGDDMLRPEPAPQMIMPVETEKMHMTVVSETRIPLVESAVYEAPSLPGEYEFHESPVHNREYEAMPVVCAPYGMVTIVKQGWNEIYEPEKGFERGTIFPCLDFPFDGKGACRYER